MERDALYYPNIQIPSVDWLKRTLLIFPHVARILPENFARNDPREIWEFENIPGRRGEPLLRGANLQTGSVWTAQRQLMRRLENDIHRDRSFVDRFSRRNARRFEGKIDASSFYLHPGKLTSNLVHLLERHDLAWLASGERRTRGFVRVHPLLGELIMSTLAIACAKDEGFNIVADDARVHHCLANHDELAAYNEFTQTQADVVPANSRINGDRLFEIIVFQRCNVAKLTPEVLAQLGDERDAIEDLKRALARQEARQFAAVARVGASTIGATSGSTRRFNAKPTRASRTSRDSNS